MKHPEPTSPPPTDATLHLEGDGALAAALADGQLRPAAARELFRRHARTVYRILRRALGTTHSDVPDLVQEVFLRFFNRVPTLRDPGALRPFLLAITVRVLKWELRRRQLRRLVGLDPVAVARATTIEPDLDAREALRRLETAIVRLRPNDRVVFVLRHFERLKLTEIAEVESISLTTVKRRLEAARRVIVEVMGPSFATYLEETDT